MSKGITYLDLFSGIGGFALGLHLSGLPIDTHYYSEIDKYCIQNYKHNFKDAIHVGNISDVRGKRARKLKRPNLITFGFPCQDLSIAGKRTGLEGQRSGLFFQALRLIKKYRPEVFIFENVKGLLSSNKGKDFETVLRSIADLGIYECQWQLVNTTWVLPQNRERVYFVGYLAGRCTPTVFPFRESDFTFNGLQGQGVNAITTRTGTAESVGAYIVEDKLSSQITDYGHTGTGGQRGRVVSDSGVNPALSATQYKDPPKVAQLNKPKHSNDRVYSDKGLSPTLNTMQGGDRQPFIIQPILTPDRQEKRQHGRRMKEDGEPAFTLTGQDKHGIVIKANTKKGTEVLQEGDSLNFSVPTSKTRRGRVGKGKAQTLDTNSNQAVALRWKRSEKGKQARKQSKANGKDYTPFSEGHRELAESKEDTSGCITGAYNKDALLMDGLQIRKLTEVECERLQGFPDDWTRWGIDNKGNKVEISSTQRYKQTGNAVTVGIVKLIGQRILNDNIL